MDERNGDPALRTVTRFRVRAALAGARVAPRFARSLILLGVVATTLVVYAVDSTISYDSLHLSADEDVSHLLLYFYVFFIVVPIGLIWLTLVVRALRNRGNAVLVCPVHGVASTADPDVASPRCARTGPVPGADSAVTRYEPCNALLTRRAVPVRATDQDGRVTWDFCGDPQAFRIGRWSLLYRWDRMALHVPSRLGDSDE